METLHISRFIEKISDSELMEAVESYLEWQSGKSEIVGIKIIETQSKEKSTVIDEIYNIYIEPLEGPGISGWLGAYSLVCEEIAKRVYLGNFKR
jgi:hypothetical protein